MNKVIPLFAFSILLLAPMGFQNVSAVSVGLQAADDAFIVDLGADGNPPFQLFQGPAFSVSFVPGVFEDQGLVEFDISGLPPGPVISATLDFNVIQIRNGPPPVTLHTYGYNVPDADGVIALSDFNTGSQIFAQPVFGPGVTSQDVTPFVSNAVTNGDPFVGFSFRSTGFGPGNTLDVNSFESGMGPMLTIEIADVVPPTALCQDTSVPLNALGTASITPTDVDDGSFDNVALASLSVVPASFDCNTLGANTVTLIVTDTSGNTSTCQATVLVEDPQNACSAPPDNQVIGGEIIPISATSLLVSGIQTNLSWIVTAAVLVAGSSAFFVLRKNE